MSLEPFYRTSFSRHIHSLILNGFYARDLDADDFAFLEHVREHGIANGSLPSSSAVLSEELDFWNFPYTVAPGIERHVGRRPPIVEVETVEQRLERKIRNNAWHARRAIREHENAIAAIELDRERREWQEANKRRHDRQRLLDAEWDAADPAKRKAKFGKTIKRHYVPEWRYEEQRRAKCATLSKAGKMIQAELAEKIAEQRKAQKFEQQQRETASQQKYEAWKVEWREREAARRQKREAQKLEREAQKIERRAKRQRNDEARQIRNEALKRQREIQRRQRDEVKQQRHEQAIANAHESLKHIAKQEQEWRRYPTADKLKEAILDLLKGSRASGHVWTREDIMRSTDCTNGALVDKCLNELVRDHRLRKQAL